MSFEIERSRATEPLFYRAPSKGDVTPKEYQYAGVEYALSRDHCLFGDAPGLGKTAECILLGNAIEAQNTLVICPASLRLNWEREVWQWSNYDGVTTCPILASKEGVSLNANYVITSYAMVTNKVIREALMSVTWDHLILDEAHALKDPHGNTRTKAVCGWMDKGTYVQGLSDFVGRITMASGTILPNSPIECYNAIRLLDHSAIDYMSLGEFRNTYYELGSGYVTGPYMGKDKLGRPVKKHGAHWSNNVRNVPRNLDDLQRRLREKIMVRRLKEQVLHELPPKQWHLFPLEVTAGIRKALRHPGYKQAQRLYELDERAFDSGIPIDGAVSTARRELGEAKAPGVADYIEELLRSGAEKVVVGAWHHTVLDYLKDRLKSHGVAYMDGNTSARAKQEAVDDFQGREDIRIILGQKGPLGQGWTLTAAQDVVDAEFDWVPGNNDQLLDRINRMGQTGSYTIGHVPVVPGTMDERIVGTAIKKDQSIYQALDAPLTSVCETNA